MTKIFYLQAGQQMPAVADDQHWLMVEANNDGRFFGTGWARRDTGEEVIYVSLAESDMSLERALEAAEQWAAKYSVPTIWVQSAPE